MTPEPGPRTPPSSDSEAPSPLARVAEIFAAVRRLAPGDERVMAVAEACRGDPALRCEVEGLLAAHDRMSTNPELTPVAGGSLRAAIEGALTAAVPLPPTTPARIGRFRIIGVLGVGGMGTVYEAEQDSPRRRVALKVLRQDVGSGEARSRFAREGEILARMEHDGIARVYEVGSAPGAHGPIAYIAMERVDGVDVRAWVSRNAPDLRRRGALLARIADALAHAHRKGVIHRDLKPANVLVTVDGTPKILDFGIARLEDQTRGATRTGALLGTVGHMSPEQLTGDVDRVDTRSDVYALGVLAYETIVGRHPFEAHAGSVATLFEAMRREEAPTLSSVAGAIPGDLSIVVAKAMARDPERRYPSAEAFADDLKRFLDGRAILARPPTRGYLMSRFVARHRLVAAAAAAVLVALVTGLVVAVSALGREREARGRADVATDRAEATAARATTRAAALQIERFTPLRARELVASVPPERRGWEWRYVDAATDDSIDDIALPSVAPGETIVVAVDGDGRLRVADAAALGPRPHHASTRSEGTPSSDDPAALLSSSAVEPPDVVLYDDVARAFAGFGRHRSSVRTLRMDGVECRVDARAEGDIVLRRVADDGPVATLKGHTDRIVAQALSPDDRALATLSLDKSIRVWDLATGKSRVVSSQETNPYAIALAGAGGPLLVAGRGGTVLAHALGTKRGSERLLGVAEPPLTLGASANGRFVVVASVRHAWSFAVGARDDLDVLVRPRADAGDRDRIYGVSLDPTGRLVACAGMDRAVRIVDRWTSDLVATIRAPAPVTSVAWDPKGRWLAYASGRIFVVDARTGRAIASGAPVEDDGRPALVARLAMSPDGGSLLTGPLETGHVNVLGLPQLTTIARWSTRAHALGSAVRLGLDRAAMVGEDGKALIVSFPDGRPLRTLDAVGPWAKAASRDGRRLAVGTLGGRVLVYDVGGDADAGPLATLTGRELVTSVAFSPDATRLFAGVGDNRLVVWDVASASEVFALQLHRAMILCLDASSVDECVVAGDAGGEVRTWDPSPLRERRRRASEARVAVARWRATIRARLDAGETSESVADGWEAESSLSAPERSHARVALWAESAPR